MSQTKPKTKYYEKESFDKLNKEWKQKLKDSGFEDIENGDNLKHWEGTNFVDKQRIARTVNNAASIELYYRLACQFLHDHKFSTQKEYRMWELHSEGLSLSETSKMMTEEGFPGVSKTRLKYAITAIKQIMLAKNEASEDEF